MPEEEWVISKNTHEAIIDQETFDIVQKCANINGAFLEKIGGISLVMRTFLQDLFIAEVADISIHTAPARRMASTLTTTNVADTARFASPVLTPTTFEKIYLSKSFWKMLTKCWQP